MALLQPREQRLVELAPGLAQQRAGEQAAAHPDPAMDPPHRQFDPGRLQRLVPGQHVLVDAVDQGAIEIEDQRRHAHGFFPTFAGQPRYSRNSARHESPFRRHPQATPNASA